jgi:hypothetical protein
VSKLSFGTGLGIALGLAGLALSLSNYRNEALADGLLIAAGVLLLISAAISLARRAKERIER